MSAHSLVQFAETARLDGHALRAEDQLDIRALVRLEFLFDGGCADGAEYRAVLEKLREARAALASRRCQQAAVEALHGGLNLELEAVQVVTE